ncbi:hypothetical protein [Marinilactibacillus piezotolerans]|uniref:hypothetical protein n=1 Tax=Marinilactibacillus piezotolerans TaxID=258723 RepID=UPI0009AFC53B|nr:hypothetical protein [Marinilactibacillus piezotolerans]
MKILMYGVNQDTVSIEDIDKYRLTEEQRVQHLHDIKNFSGVEEICILSSDERSEYYLNVDETIFKHGDLLRYLSAFTGKPLKEIILETYSKFNKDVVQHLFTIVSGMEKRPKGSYTELQFAENALNLGVAESTLGSVMSGLFKDAIQFSRKMRLSEAMGPLYSGQPSRAIETFYKKIGQTEDKKFVLFGSDYDVVHLAKLLLSINIQSLTIANTNLNESKVLIDQLKDWINTTTYQTQPTRLHAADLQSVGYRFSNADGIVFSASFESSMLTEAVFEEVDTIRQTKKKQVIVDFTQQDEARFESLGELVVYTSIDEINNKDFTEEQQNQADIYFDEQLLQVTDRFMEQYQLQSEKIEQEPIEKLPIWRKTHTLDIFPNQMT